MFAASFKTVAALSLKQTISAAGLAVFLMTVIIGYFSLPCIRKMHFGQKVRVDGPKSHYKKSGTPTFGGSFFLIPIIVIGVVVALCTGTSSHLLPLLLFMFLAGIIGAVDDYVKVRINPEGLSVKQKTLLLGAVDIMAAIYAVFLMPQGCFIIAPFSGRYLLVTGIYKIIYAVILVPFIFYMSNSVNITDGLDGLLSGLMAIAYMFLFAVAFCLYKFHIADSYAVSFAVINVAGTMGFLLYNRHPAKIFMGDLGSQALGIGFALYTVMIGMPYLALITGFVFFFEGFSVVMQTLYFRKTGGKRIFKMAPIHHHFELCGWKESKVTLVFWLCGFLSGVIGLLFLLPIIL